MQALKVKLGSEDSPRTPRITRGAKTSCKPSPGGQGPDCLEIETFGQPPSDLFVAVLRTDC